MYVLYSFRICRQRNYDTFRAVYMRMVSIVETYRLLYKYILLTNFCPQLLIPTFVNLPHVFGKCIDYIRFHYTIVIAP